LVNLLDDIRKSGRGGLTAIGSLPHYAAKKTYKPQATEDLVDLISMYLFDPDYFADFFEFMTQDHLDKSSVGLATITREEKDNIERKILILLARVLGRVV